MADFFLKIVNMSISASWIVLAVLFLRLLLKKAPKWINVIFWGIVGFRLVMPFSFESVFSLIPSGETISKAPDAPRPHFESGVTIIDDQVNDYLGGHYYEGVTRPTGHFLDVTTILAIVWIVGIVVLLAYTVISYLRVKNKIGTAVIFRDNIYQSENVVSPFVLGIINPKIYIPFNMNCRDMEHVISHEKAHIRRKDHLWKPFGFLVLTLHWFNPFMWLGYVFLCRDIELACDEKVVKEFNNEQKADYSQALLTCSVNRRIIAACPLAFGEVGVKNRVKSVLNYKKPAFWVIVIAIVASIAVAVCFLTNPQKSKISDSFDDSLFENVEEVQITVPAQSIDIYYISNFQEIVDFVKEIEVSKKEISKSKDENRPRDINVILKYSDSYSILHFDKDCNQIWVDDNVNPSYSYEIRNSNAVKEFFNELFNKANAQKITWAYRPMLSYSGHSFKAFDFDFDYTHIEASCSYGYMNDLQTDGQPSGKLLRFENGKNVYWSPQVVNSDEIPDITEVKLAIYNNSIKLYDCTIIFECVGRDMSSAQFDIYLKNAGGLSLLEVDGLITVIEKSNLNYAAGVDIKELQGKYPEFFDVSTDGGLTVYIWQNISDDFRCYLANTAIEAISDNSFAYKIGATITEMRAILTTYYIERSKITVQAVNNPLSEYHYEIDDDYRAKVSALFWAESNMAILYDVQLSTANWTDDSSIYLKALNTTKMQTNSIKHLPVYKFNSVKDLENFKSDFSNIFTFESTWDEVPSFNSVTEKYNSQFFNKNTLFLVYIAVDNCTHRFDLGSMVWDEKSFCLNVEETTGADFVSDALAGWFLTVAVPNEIVETCTQFDADLNNVIKQY